MPDMILTADHPEGFIVAEVKRDRYFSVTAMIYSSRRAYDLGNEESVHSCGCLHDEILAAFPQLAPIVALHLADVETGEPMHGPANGWYRLGGKDLAHELDYRSRGRQNYYNAPEPYGEDGGLAPEFAGFFVGMAARGLNVEPSELPNVQDPALFAQWIDSYARPRWAAAAAAANAWIDARQSDPLPTQVDGTPADEDSDVYTAEFDAGLRIHSEHSGTGHRQGVGWYDTYRVTIRAGRKSYSTIYGGSVADHDDGRMVAREAAFGVLRELCGFLDQSAEEIAEDYGMEDMTAEMWRQWRRIEAATDRMRDALEANLEIIGR